MWLLSTVGGLGGCGPAIRADFHSPEPAARNAAIAQAAASNDASAVPDMVRLLDSDDPATRVLAIQGLERLTSEDYGYDPAGTPAQRIEAVERWVRHVRDMEAAQPGEPR